MSKAKSIPLTDGRIAKIALPPRRFTSVHHGPVKGLTLRVYPSGVRSWVLTYRLDGKQFVMTLGEYPGVSLHKAGSLAEDLWADIDRGLNPQATGGGADRVTLGQLFREFTATGEYKSKSETWRRQFEGNFDLYVLPALGSALVAELRRRDVLRFLNKLQAPSARYRAHANVRRLLAYGVAMEYLEANVAAGLKIKHGTKPRTRVLSPAELRFCWHANGDRLDVQAAIRVLILTGCRVGEALGLMWSDVNLEAGELVFRNTKSDRNHWLPVTKPLADALHMARTWRPFADRPFTMSYDLVWHRLTHKTRAAGLEQLTIHDLRRSLAFGLCRDHDLVSEADVGLLLNHAPVNVTGRHYVHAKQLDAKRRIMDRWYEWLCDQGLTESGNVVDPLGISSWRKPDASATLR